MTVRERICQAFQDEEFLFLDGFDDCIVGVVERIGGLLVVAYDGRAIVEKLMDGDDLAYAEAVEHFECNIAGAWVGERTPAFFTPLVRLPEVA